MTSTVIAGFVPQVTWGTSDAGVDRDVAVEGGRVVGPQRLPVGDRRVEGRPSRRERAGRLA